jgi:hypothetical protein
VCGHDRVDSGGDVRFEGRQVDLMDLLQRVGHLRQAEVAVHAGVPVAREVLGDRSDPARVVPLHLR